MLLFLKGINKGKYVFRTNNNQTIYVKDIDTEKLVYLEESLKYIENNLNYTFNSFTIDGRKGVIELLNKLYPKVQIQRCIVHIIRNCVAFVNYKDLEEVCNTMKPIYKANTEEEALFKLTEFENTWKNKYPYISKIWRNNWNEIKTMFQYPQEIRRLIYTTNPIESFNNGIKRITKTKGSFKSDNSLLKLMYLITQDITKKWTKPIQNWSLIFNQLLIFFGGRMDCFLNNRG